MNDLFNQPEVFFSQQNYPMQATPCGRGFHIEVPHGRLCYIPNFIDKKIADRTLAVFFENAQYDWKNTDWHLVEDINNVDWKNIQWHQDIIKMYGKSHALPRVSAWYGDTGKVYKYSGILLQPNPWNPALQWMKQQLATVCDTPFNSVLLNWYRSGQDYISWHTDAENELGPNPTIASLNFGEARRFLLRRNDDHDDKIEIRLAHGDLLIMHGELQHFWQHSVPKQAKIKDGRLNMTFRHIL
ncbi:alpha-ketoglutarate-dependent dioxygenase AlkB [Acinetobacter baumannii]|uniref:alpha-ketoglutarate-dependent dioxygenase AlkB family protein n=1 Tax=Acinetobacter TaxID=469 RepID=UPI000CEC9FAF|nr:alpha-ketoglutarate-dependent dioxygenase AlkB [Acinetobacter indicus]MDC5100601.1 alpha-ketoglutarate-dependent dioxygenase AlkB [Acinetobacter baumannii]MDC5510933.1 alpha-ketoglutarate-dependent dioxygenase AlkB [Acinetobacter baumannii]